VRRTKDQSCSAKQGETYEEQTKVASPAASIPALELRWRSFISARKPEHCCCFRQRANQSSAMCFTRVERLSASRCVAMVLMAPFVPLLAAAFQSGWIVLLRGTRTYQAVLCPYHPENNDVHFWLWQAVLVPQVLAAVVLLWPLVRFPGLHRLIAALVFAGCLYYDCFVATRWVLH
jgi:hypothetical protein